MRHVQAIDLFIAEFASRGRKPSACRKYEAELQVYPDTFGKEYTIEETTHADCVRVIGRPGPRAGHQLSNTTRGTRYSIHNTYFGRLCAMGFLSRDANPMAEIERAVRLKPEYVDVPEVGPEDVQKLILGCKDFQELICLGAAAYLGRRRAALANARRHDADLSRGIIRFVDKGSKVFHQPIPDEFLAVLREAEQHGVWASGDDYLIPNRRQSTTNPKARNSKIIYETVKRVAKREGVSVTVHALRAAFAVQFLETHPGRIESLKELLGHDRIETTLVYLRRMNKAHAMEDARDLSWIPSPAVERADRSTWVEVHGGVPPAEQQAPGFRSEQERRIRDSNPCSNPPAEVGPLGEKLAELRALQERPRGRDRC